MTSAESQTPEPEATAPEAKSRRDRTGPVAVRPRGERTDRRTEKIAFGVGMIILLYVLWEIVTAMKLEPAILLPGPADVGVAFKDVFSNSAIWTDLRVSGEEFLYGYVLATVVGIVFGILIGWYARVGYMLDPLVNFMYAVPRVALTPLLIIWLGIGLTSKIALVFLIAVFPILITTSSGVRNLDPQLLRTARCFGAGDLQIFRTVALPASVPFILSGLRLAVGQAIIGVFVAELVGAQNGVGQMMNNAAGQFQTSTVFVGLIIFAVAGVLFNGLVRAAERHFDAWRA
jgi:NitT/TauT family transport system permease protein